MIFLIPLPLNFSETKIKNKPKYFADGKSILVGVLMWNESTTQLNSVFFTDSCF
jgi:hypothetical protein